MLPRRPCKPCLENACRDADPTSFNIYNMCGNSAPVVPHARYLVPHGNAAKKVKETCLPSFHGSACGSCQELALLGNFGYSFRIQHHRVLSQSLLESVS